MKTISIFDVQNINALLKENNKDYILKLKDVCGSPSLSLECVGITEDIHVLCTIINTYLKDKYVSIQPGAINPYNIILV